VVLKAKKSGAAIGRCASYATDVELATSVKKQSKDRDSTSTVVRTVKICHEPRIAYNCKVVNSRPRNEYNIM
jgi:hypothetical protein